MSERVFLYSDEYQRYDMGADHPLRPSRLVNTYRLLSAYSAFDGVVVAHPKPCSLDWLGTAHSQEYIDAVDRLSTGEHVPFPGRYGFGHGDNPVFPDMYEASLLYTGASLDAAEAICSGEARASFNISGGLHHAHFDRAAGFCVFNDCVVAINRLRERFDRVAYIDIDVHHGDGVQEAYYSDPSVLTISIHESGQTLFPGTGFVKEIGEGGGAGYSVNLPLWPYTDDEAWYYAWSSGAMPILRAFRPETICLECGTDPHYLDPLARLCLTAQGWLKAIDDVMSLGVPVVALGGGGYNATTVPRMWALAYGSIFGVQLADETPTTFEHHTKIPTLRDTEEPEIAVRDRDYARGYARQMIEEVRSRLFSYHGL